jgi:hypothetical protein
MKLGLSFTAILVACITAGCAANPGLQSQVDALQKKNEEQHREIQDLSAKAAKCNGRLVAGDLQQDASDLATAAWAWLTTQASDARHAASPIISCYRAGASDVHSLDDAQRLMAHCYNIQP